MSDTPKTDAFREVIFAQYKEDELTGNGMGNILAALPDIESLERKRECECKCDVDWPEEYYELRRRLERERDEWKKKFIQQNKDLGCEMMDPNGTIWDYAKKLQDDIAGWETKWKCAVEMAAIAENERDELKQQLDAAIMLGKMQERRHERELEQVREQYRLSSVCRNLMIENQKLKGEQP